MPINTTTVSEMHTAEQDLATALAAYTSTLVTLKTARAAASTKRALRETASAAVGAYTGAVPSSALTALVIALDNASSDDDGAQTDLSDAVDAVETAKINFDDATATRDAKRAALLAP